MEMFCYQCEQTVNGGCAVVGNCGKDPRTAALQDLLTYVTEGIAQYAHRAARVGAWCDDIDLFTLQALFTTVTNVNFDPQRMQELLTRAAEMLTHARTLYENRCAETRTAVETLNGPTTWSPAADLNGLVLQGSKVGIRARMDTFGRDVAGLQELLLYGVKGMAAYADHAYVLGKRDREVACFIYEALDYLCDPAPTVERLLALNMQCGATTLRVIEMLDAAHTSAFGHPSPTPVRVTPLKGKAVLVSGHDLKDLHALLTQTEGKGINVYTHGEMLPAHGYPELRKFKHLAGNYGGAWQDQRAEFEKFPGAILMTTNCIQMPAPSYIGRMYTSGMVAWPGVAHIADGNFAPLIHAALSAPGFGADEPEHTIVVGFGHQAVLSAADKVIGAVKSGAIRRLYLIGGCDGAKTGRDYYTRFAEALPQDCVLLTLACGKYRFNKRNFGSIAGIPRLLDCGQCNDAYSAVKIAQGLARAFHCGVNDLPLSLVVSWYEQKAVAILLALLHLGIQNIRLGPTLPAFITPTVLQVLVEKFKIKPITTVEQDLEATLAGA